MLYDTVCQAARWAGGALGAITQDSSVEGRLHFGLPPILARHQGAGGLGDQAPHRLMF